MVHRTGYMLKGDGKRYSQVETILLFYRQKFVSSGKHLLFENETFIGNLTVRDGENVFNGVATLTDEEKAELLVYLKAFMPPDCDAHAPQFGFGIQLEGNLTYCEVLQQNDLYEIWYDGKPVAELSQNEQFSWQQVSGQHLAPSVFREITERIEGHYSE